jgi:hypothetical protein
LFEPAAKSDKERPVTEGVRDDLVGITTNCALSHFVPLIS